MDKRKPEREDETPGKAGATTLTEAQLDAVSAARSRVHNNIKQLALAAQN